MKSVKGTMVLNKIREAQLRVINVVESSLLDRRALLSRSLDRKDVDGECGYPETISLDQYRASYDRIGIGKRVVEVYPEESWALDPLVYETEDASETEFELSWNALQEALNLYYNLQQVDTLSGIGRFGVLFLGFGDGDRLEKPVPGIDVKTGDKKGAGQETTAPDQAMLGGKPTGRTPALNFVKCFAEDQVTITQRESSVTSKRYGQPTMYKLKFSNEETTGGNVLPGATPTEQSKDVHWTRVLHVADNCAGSSVLGTPRQQAVYNQILDVKKCLGAGAEGFWKGSNPGLILESQPGITEADLDLESIKDEVESFQLHLQKYMALMGVSVKPLLPTVVDPNPQYNVLVDAISLALGVPKRILSGSERGELASSQDQKAWNMRLAKRQAKYITPCIVRPFVDRLIAAGVLPEPARNERTQRWDYKVDWRDLNSITDEEKANVAKLRTEALSSYVLGGIDQVIPPRLYLTMIMELDPDEVEEIMTELEVYMEEKVQKELDQQIDGALQQMDAGTMPDPTLDPNAAPVGNAEPVDNAAALREVNTRLSTQLDQALRQPPKVELTLRDERTTTIQNHLPAPLPTPVTVENRVTVEPTPLQLTLPTPEAPVVHVNVAPPEVKVENVVNVPKPTVAVEVHMPPRNVQVKRDADGRITGTTSTDAK